LAAASLTSTKFTVTSTGVSRSSAKGITMMNDALPFSQFKLHLIEVKLEMVNYQQRYAAILSELIRLSPAHGTRQTRWPASGRSNLSHPGSARPAPRGVQGQHDQPTYLVASLQVSTEKRLRASPVGTVHGAKVHYYRTENRLGRSVPIRPSWSN